MQRKGLRRASAFHAFKEVSPFIYIISHGYITENFMTSKLDFP